MRERPPTGIRVAGEPAPWHALAPEDALARLDSSPAGLDEEEAARRLALHGPNLLRPPVPLSPWRLLANQLRGVVPLLLAAAGLVSLAAGDELEASAIAAVLLLDAGIGFATEWRAHRAMHALRTLQVGRATARRGGREGAVDAASLVPGDVVVLEAGAAIAADARVLAASELRAIEAPLTGEPFPVDKAPGRVAAAAPLAERTSMVFKGTLAAAGSGLAVVTATGRETEVGKVSELVESIREGATPLERSLDRLGRSLVGVTLVIAALVAGAGVLRGGEPWLMVQTGLALAVAAVPEGLPVVATVVLAVGLHRMARRRAIVRRLPAVETLGSMTVLCTDKTGTLTAGKMTVTKLHVAGGAVDVLNDPGRAGGAFVAGGRPVEACQVPGLEPALAVAMLANRARLDRGGGAAEGDPTEVALLVAARKAGLVRETLLAALPEEAEVPFHSERKLMATFHRSPGGTVACVKGGPGEILARCATRLAAGGPRSLDDRGREELLAANAELAGRGLRVLALARRELDPGEKPGQAALQGLEWLGMAGIEDAPVPGVERTVAALRDAGVRVVMLTGDQRLTAAEVARRLGILGAGDEVLEGSELGALSEDELRERLPRVSAFSRLAPADKVRVVEALQGTGEVVAMLGDGINDGPALRRADIGVALGLRGTDVAKETAAVVLADDRLETVVAAVAEGRVIRDNVEKVLFYLFSCNLAEILVLGGGLAGGFALPLAPLQILWLNLVTDVFPALALAMEPAEPGVMRAPPRRPGAQLVSRAMLVRIALSGLALAAATLGAFGWALARGAGEAEARTVAFLTLALAQLLHVWDARSAEPVLLGRRVLQNGWVWAALLGTSALQALVITVPALAARLGTVTPSGRSLAVVAAAALLPLLGTQLVRGLARRRQRADGRGWRAM